jgi:multidrug resistance efflux pump
MPEQTHKKEKKNNRALIIWITSVVVVIVAIGGGAFWYVSSKTVYIDQSDVVAPLINLSPAVPGPLQAVYVKEGDTVPANTPVAEIGNQTLDTTVSGEIVSVDNTIGETVNPGQTVVSMIDPTQLRIVGHLDENAGLEDIHLGDPATFTVDAFGSKKYQGVVDEIAPSAQQTDVVFNISDQRPTNQFAVYVRFDPTAYPELKNGMSARIWIYKN